MAQTLHKKQKPVGSFGDIHSDHMFNTRDGGPEGTEINMHDDEPVVLGETSMDSSSSSGSDGEETAEDAKNYNEALKRADSRMQLSKRHKKHKKKAPPSRKQLFENDEDSEP